MEIRVEEDENYNCQCVNCSYVWNAFDTEHFNFTMCPVCMTDDIIVDGKRLKNKK